MKRIGTLHKAQQLVNDAKYLAEDNMDVIDGEDGTPRPDRFMQIFTALEEADSLLESLWDEDKNQ